MSDHSEATLQAILLKHSAQGAGWEKTIDNAFSAQTVSSLAENCYIFLDKQNFSKAQGSLEELLGLFDIPPFVATRTCVDLNGYFGCKPNYTSDQLTSCSTWFRCLVKMIRKVDYERYDSEPEYVSPSNGTNYLWFEMGFYARWDSQGSCQVLCVDTPFDLPNQLKAALEKRPSGLNFKDPFAMQVDLIDMIIKYYDISVWRIRDPVRKLEQDRPYTGQFFKPMHDISRHTIHTAEILSAAIETFQEMQLCQIEFYENLNDHLDKTYQEQAKKYAKFQIQVLKNLKLRSESNQKRLENEVNLAFNTIANQDNTVMKSIALLTTVFLPATFLSALFSSSFFNFGDEGWKVSTGFWIYWVITAPITILVMVAFRVWMAHTAKIQKIIESFTRLWRN